MGQGGVGEVQHNGEVVGGVGGRGWTGAKVKRGGGGGGGFGR